MSTPNASKIQKSVLTNILFILNVLLEDGICLKELIF